MNMSKLNEYSTTSDSDSEYLVDTRYYRTTVKCKRKSLKKTIKLIHGRCVVIYRGSGDLLPIAAKDADTNSYADFVFVCHEPKPNNQIKETSHISQSNTPKHDSIISDDVSLVHNKMTKIYMYINYCFHQKNDDDEDEENNNAFQKGFINLNSNQRLSKPNSFSFKTKINGNNNNTDAFTIRGKESLSMQSNYINNENRSLLVEDIDLDLDKLINDNQPSPTVIHCPTSSPTSIFTTK